MPTLPSEALLSEYESIIADIGADASDEAIVSALVSDGDWTELGARTVVRLARNYGTSILRNALALASALRIEDGEAGL